MKSGKLWDTALQIILPDFLKAVSDVRPLIFVNTVLRKKNSDSPGPCTATGKTARGRQGQKQKTDLSWFFPDLSGFFFPFIPVFCLQVLNNK